MPVNSRSLTSRASALLVLALIAVLSPSPFSLKLAIKPVSTLNPPMRAGDQTLTAPSVLCLAI